MAKKKGTIEIKATATKTATKPKTKKLTNKDISIGVSYNDAINK